MNAKLLLLILGGLIVLFFVGTGWGLLSGDQSVGGAAEAIVNMVRGLQAKEPLSPDEVVNATPANCRRQLRQRRFTLAQGESCQFDVGESSTPVRTLTLRLQSSDTQSGDEVELEMDPDEGDMDPVTLSAEEKDGQRDDELEVQFVREGGRLVITCTDATGVQNQCVIDVISS